MSVSVTQRNHGINVTSMTSLTLLNLAPNRQRHLKKITSNLNSLLRSVPCVTWKKVSRGAIQKQERGNCSQQHNAINGNVLLRGGWQRLSLSQREHIQLWHHRRHHNKLDGVVLPNDVYHLMCTRWDLITFPLHGVKLSVYPWAEASAPVFSARARGGAFNDFLRRWKGLSPQKRKTFFLLSAN